MSISNFSTKVANNLLNPATDYAGNFGSPVQLLILLAIVLLLFGGNRLRNLGGDIGSAIKGFKNSMASNDQEKARELEKEKLSHDVQSVIEGRVEVVQGQHKS